MSKFPAMVSRMIPLRTSSPKCMAQPPSVNPFVGSSSGPPGACMTPSSVTWVIAMSFLIVRLLKHRPRHSTVEDAGIRQLTGVFSKPSGLTVGARSLAQLSLAVDYQPSFAFRPFWPVGHAPPPCGVNDGPHQCEYKTGKRTREPQ